MPRDSRESRHPQRLRKGLRNGLLAIDVLAGRDCALEQRNAHLRGARIEEDAVLRIGQGCVEVRRVPRDIVKPGDLRKLLGIAADQDGIGHRAVAVRQQHAARGADRGDRADEVLVVAHPTGHAVHDKPKPLNRHNFPRL